MLLYSSHSQNLLELLVYSQSIKACIVRNTPQTFSCLSQGVTNVSSFFCVFAEMVYIHAII